MTTNISIGQLAEDILAEVRVGESTKTAQLEMAKVANAVPTTPVASAMHTVAQMLKQASDTDVTVGDVARFVEELRHAS